MVKTEKDHILQDGEVFSRVVLLEQMERVLESRHFRNSRRYPALLRYVVEQTLAGGVDGLKERTLGVDVFARVTNYDTNADPVVRVTAGEIRKRLAQYYQEPGHETEVRIDLPSGGYIPRFTYPGAGREPERVEVEPTPLFLPQAPVPEPGPPVMVEVVQPVFPPELQPVRKNPVVTRHWRRTWLPMTGVLCLLLAGLAAWVAASRQRKAEQGISYFWQTALGSPNPFTIVIGVHSLDETGKERENGTPLSESGHRPADMLDTMIHSDMVPVSDIVAHSRVTDLLTRHNRRYTTLGSGDASIEAIRGGPMVLIGGLDNVWTLRLTAKLRFHFSEKLQTANAILDSEHPGTVWRFNNMQDAAATTQDYAIVASYFDTTIDQSVLVIAGIGKAGTQIAAEFLTNEEGLRHWMEQSRSPAVGKNVEMVLSTQVVDGKAGPPRVVASATW